MRYSPSEKLEVIWILEDSELFCWPQTLYLKKGSIVVVSKWYHRYLEDGVNGLGAKKSKARTFWNKIPDKMKWQIVQQALE